MRSRPPRRGCGAHPRSRGENLKCGFAESSGGGSSPLTRGKHCSVLSVYRAGGLIPAHAGKTGAGGGDRSTVGAHPRSRGENNEVVKGGGREGGSSPLTRGKRRLRRGRAQRHGLIPAHAGKTDNGLGVHGFGPAHPRSRGENIGRRAWNGWAGGSSPLTRGKRRIGRAFLTRPRLIPAHAGKTSIVSSRFRAWRAHPRSRGENSLWFGTDGSTGGSSPLTRGKPLTSISRAVRPGLIPAHAGKTCLDPQRSSIGTAHPRSRGENDA